MICLPENSIWPNFVNSPQNIISLSIHKMFQNIKTKSKKDNLNKEYNKILLYSPFAVLAKDKLANCNKH